MPDRVHPSVHDVQPAALHTVVDGATPEPERQELPPRDDAVLPRGQPRDDGVDRSRLRFTPYDGVKCRVDPHPAERATRAVPRGARFVTNA
jgi:hypothetical protein